MVPSGPTLDINPGRSWVNNPEGYAHLGSLSIDATQGTLKGYAAYRLDEAKSIVKSPNLIGIDALDPARRGPLANVVGALTFSASVDAPEGETQLVTLQLSLDGRLVEQIGHPTLSIVGAASIVNNLGGDFHGASVDAAFSNFDYANSAIVYDGAIHTSDAFTVLDFAGQRMEPPYATGLSHTVQYLSTNPDSLGVVMSVTAPVRRGDSLTFISLVGAVATHGFVDDFFALDVGASGQVAAAAGYADLLNTGRMRIFLPEGVSLSGIDAPPPGIVFVTSVPEPATALLCLAGLVLMVTRRACTP